MWDYYMYWAACHRIQDAELSVSISRKRWRILTIAAACVLIIGVVAAVVGSRASRAGTVRSVLLVSVDGLHQRDFAWFVRNRPRSTLATLAAEGVEYTDARTPIPSDSFPGLVGQLTGGEPAVTGIYYDDSFNRALLPAGTQRCAGAKPGVEVRYTEDLDRSTKSIDAGQGLAGLPEAIMGLTSRPAALIDPTKLPVDPVTCAPIYPHSYLRVNTVFDIARRAGLRTAWSDKHPAYDVLNGASGDAVQDLFAPEINSQVPGRSSDGDWTTDNGSTQIYDSYKVRAVLNEIDGYDHSRTTSVGVPAIFGMNFQSVSTAQKLPGTAPMTGGYLADGVTPGLLLTRSLDYVDAQLAAMVAELRKVGLDRSTAIIVSAKHGQSPTEPAALTRIDDKALTDGLNAQWAATHPGTGPLVVQATDDDAMMMWLSDRSPTATEFARYYLLSQDGVGNGIDGRPKSFTSSGLRTLYAGADAARYFKAAPNDPAVPDLYGVTAHGVVYTGGTSKIAEHGGADTEDQQVALVVDSPAAAHGRVVTQRVATTQIAPTVLRLLGLNPELLDAVHTQHTPELLGVIAP
jgi:hypothetical protein